MQFYKQSQAVPSMAWNTFSKQTKAKQLIPSWFPIISSGTKLKSETTIFGPCNLFIWHSSSRSQSVEERKTYVKLVESVRDNGGTTRIFSSLHVSGERKFEFITKLRKKEEILHYLLLEQSWYN